MKLCTLLPVLTVSLLLAACGDPAVEFDSDADQQGHSAPSEFTREANKSFAEALPISDQQDFEDARRGFIATAGSVVVSNEQGGKVWDLPAYDFIEGDAPSSVNPEWPISKPATATPAA